MAQLTYVANLQGEIKMFKVVHVITLLARTQFQINLLSHIGKAILAANENRFQENILIANFILLQLIVQPANKHLSYLDQELYCYSFFASLMHY